MHRSLEHTGQFFSQRHPCIFLNAHHYHQIQILLKCVSSILYTYQHSKDLALNTWSKSLRTYFPTGSLTAVHVSLLVNISSSKQRKKIIQDTYVKNGYDQKIHTKDNLMCYINILSFLTIESVRIPTICYTQQNMFSEFESTTQHLQIGYCVSDCIKNLPQSKKVNTNQDYMHNDAPKHHKEF